VPGYLKQNSIVLNGTTKDDNKMITKIRELIQIRGVIDELTQKINKQEKAIKDSGEESIKLRKQIIDIKNQNQKMLAKFKTDKDCLDSFKNNLENELYDFKLFKNTLQEKFSSKIESEFNILKKDMGNSVQEFNESKKKLDTKLSGIEKLDTEINRLVKISTGIKQADFKLEKMAKEVKNSESEKVELHRKIDALERLVAKMRRKR